LFWHALGKIYSLLLNHSRNAAYAKLKEGVIGEAELDDVGCVIVLADFFADGFLEHLPVVKQTAPSVQGGLTERASRRVGEEKHEVAQNEQLSCLEWLRGLF